MSIRKSVRFLGFLIVVLLVLLAAVPMGPAAGEPDDSLRVRSCGFGRARTENPAKPSVYAKTTEATPTDLAVRQDNVELILFAASITYRSTLSDLVAEFESSHPGISISIVENPGSATDVLSVLLQMAEGGGMPDLILTSSDYIEVLYQLDALMELNQNRLPFSDLLNSSGETCNCEDGFYGFPVTVNNLALFFNADVFEEVGVDYPAPGWTFDDVYAAAETFAQYGIYGLSVPNQGYFYYPIMTGFGGSIFGSSYQTVTLDSSASVDALGWTLDMIANGYMPADADYSSGRALFFDGDAAMMFGAASDLAEIGERGLSLGVTDIPGGGYPMVSTQALMIGNTAYYDEAHSFIEFVSQYDNMALISDVAGLPSPLESVLDSSGSALQAIAYAGADGSKKPYSTVSFIVFSNFDFAVQTAFAGDLSAEEALSLAADNIREELGGD